MAEQRRDRVARTVDHGATAVAGTVGAALGGAKLRDAYKDDYGSKHLKAVTGHADRVAPKAGRLTRALSEGNPAKFKYLAVGSAAAATAAGASAYREHRKKELRKSVATIEANAKRKTDRGQGLLARTSVVDDSIRRARLKLVPSQTKIVVHAAQDAGETVQGQLKKADRRKHTYQAGAAGAGVGAVAATRSAVGESRDAHGRWSASRAAFNRSERSFGAARDHEQQLDAQRAGMLRPVGTTGNVGGSMRTRIGEMDSMENARRLRHNEGMGAYRTGQREAVKAGLSLRRVRNKTLLAGGLATAAVAAERRSHRDDHR